MATHIYVYTENGTNRKWQFLFVCCQQKREKANFCLFVVNGNGKRNFAFIGWQR